MTIWLASGNAHKKQELSAILASAGCKVELRIPADEGMDFDPDETGSTFAENALIKARALYDLAVSVGAPAPVIAEVSGVCVVALGGRPGIFSARYGCSGRFGSSGRYTGPLDASCSEGGKKLEAPERNALLLAELGDNPQRSARFVCAMVLLFSPDRFYLVQETLEGELVRDINAARGRGGFGYDPIFFVPGLGRTAAELSEEEKNSISHRGKAGKAIAGLLAGEKK
jgi:XTP/dITP diphosphohydrolase